MLEFPFGAAKRVRLNKISRWILPAAFAAFVLLFFPFRFVFEFNPDEGLHLMRSLLQVRGYELYSEIFSDQPPLFTWALSTLFSVFGFNVNLGRLLVLSLSTLLVGSAVAYLQESWGTPHAISAWAILMLLPKYMELSVSVMISLPAIALAVASFYALTRWHRNRSRLALILSAAALAFSVMTKLFTGVLVPIFAAGILISEFKNRPTESWRGKLEAVSIWSLVFGLLVLVTALLGVGPKNLPQLLNVHLSALDTDRYLIRRETHSINYVLREAVGILVLAFLAGLIALKRRKWSAVYLMAWAIFAYAVLTQILPVWSHHQLLVSIPAAILAAILLGETTVTLTTYLRLRKEVDLHLVLHAIGLLGAVAILGIRWLALAPQVTSRLPNLRYRVHEAEVQEYEILALMWKYADRTDLVVTDRPMYAFRIEKPVPPELAVISEKRLWAGSITQAQIIDIINDQQPEQVLLIRFPLKEVEMALEPDYEPIYYLEHWRLFLRADQLSQVGEAQMAIPLSKESARPPTGR